MNEAKPEEKDKKDKVEAIKTKPKKEAKTSNNKLYIGYTARLIIYIITFLICFSAGALLLTRSFRLESAKTINYNEQSNLDYKVYLKKNEFYDSEYLGKDMLYVASLIDKINIDFNYDFNIDEQKDLDFNYSIVGKLIISNASGDKNYFEKEYTLLNQKDLVMSNNTHQNIRENIDVNYGEFNTLANKFRSTYGVETVSKLNVYMVVNKKNTENETEFTINNNSVMNIVIPLSEKAIDIKLDYNEINKQSNIVSNSNLLLNNIIYLGLSLILVVTAIVMMIKAMRLISRIQIKKTNYDKYINKLLRDYDRLIVETPSAPVTEGLNVIKINKFTELLDVRDNLKLPVKYFVIAPHQKCCFYINHENEIYIHTIKAVDIEENK